MNYLRQFLRILGFTFAGELLSVWIPLPVPASVYGLVLLFLALQLGLVRLEQVQTVGDFLVSLLPLLFVAPVVNLISCWDVVRENLLPIAAVIVLSTLAVFGISGRLTQKLLEGKEDGHE